MSDTVYDLIIVGAGPCGLACGIEAQKAGLNFLILEKGNITEAIRRYPSDMVFFSTANNLEIGSIPFLSQNMRPNRREALKYYRAVSQHFQLPIQAFTCVEDIDKDELFTISTNKGTYKARFVILAIGYYDIPKHINIPGEELPHVSHYYDEPFLYTGTKVVVVGGANSAIETALDLYRNGAEVSLVHQFGEFDKGAKYWIVPDLENRIKKGEVTAYFNSRISRISEKSVEVTAVDGSKKQDLPADYVFLMTGYRPDAEFMQRCGIQLNGEAYIPTLKPETYESNVPDLYLAGSVVGGEETAKVFIENGKLHAQPIVQDILRRLSRPL